jgi:preprotein translocase subunit SecD
MANTRWKLITILVVFVVFAGVGVYPILAARRGIQSPSWLMDKQLKLGLDLKGGVHLVLRVQTDDALRLETDTETERLREELTKRNIPFTNLVAPDATHFRVEGVPPAQDAAFRAAANEVQANFDRSPGANGTYIFTMKPNVQVTLRDEAVVQARETLERRVNDLGVTEELLVNGQVPSGMEVVPGATGGPGNAATTVYYLVRKVAAVTGRDLRNARASLDENNQPAVSFTLSNEGGRKFGNVTGENIGRQLAIILDGRVQSAPSINGRITTDGRITGSFTNEEVANLSLILRSGALPAKLDYLEERTIGPSLGADSIRSGTTASFVGLLLIVVFMLIYYRFSGINAVIALTFNLVILLGLMAYIGAVMTLPGIAGFVLTMGIGVDSNVLIFERIKEELEAGHGVRASMNAGFSRVFWTLFDTHIAALISAAFLFNFGTGPIRGFAVTLMLGLASNLFTSIFVSKTLFELELSSRGHGATLSI